MDTTTGPYFGFVLSACIGGAIVLVGILMEVLADKEQFRNVRAFRFWHVVKFWGEILVIIGVAIEVVVAGFAAKDEWQTKQMAIKNAPFNQPLTDLSAMVIFHIDSTNANGILQKSPGVSWPGYLFLNGTNIDLAKFSEFCTLQAYQNDIKYRPIYVPTTDGMRPAALVFEMTCHLWQRVAAKPIPRIGTLLTVGDIMSNVNSLEIYVTKITNNVSVIGGHVELLINGGVRRKEFEIPERKASESGTNIAFDNCLKMVATNVTPRDQ